MYDLFVCFVPGNFVFSVSRCIPHVAEVRLEIVLRHSALQFSMNSGGIAYSVAEIRFASIPERINENINLIIFPLVLRSCAPELTLMLTRLFMCMYSYPVVKVPDLWKSILTHPIPKKGDFFAYLIHCWAAAIKIKRDDLEVSLCKVSTVSTVSDLNINNPLKYWCPPRLRAVPASASVRR